MGKIKTTVSSIKNAYASNYLFGTGYCNLQYLFYYDTPKAYTCGTYGWKFDLYDIDNVGVTTGYSSVGNRIPYEIVKKFEGKAEKIVLNNNLKWETKKRKIEKLQQDFRKALLDTTLIKG